MNINKKLNDYITRKEQKGRRLTSGFTQAGVQTRLTQSR